jgi:hypothetical protein
MLIVLQQKVNSCNYRNVTSINDENVNLREYKWNETVSNRIRYASNEMCNTCATSHVTADNSRPLSYLN